MQRVVEPGEISVWVGTSSGASAARHTIHLTGDAHSVTIHDARLTEMVELPR